MLDIRPDIKLKIWKNVKEWLVVLLFFVLVNCLLIQPFKIPSGSMTPTLLVGDFLLVNKYLYGYSNESFRIGTFTFPLPKIEKRLFENKLPERGEVVVFRNEKDRNLNYIKRIIGLPGDKVQLIDGVVHINDKPCPLEDAGEYSGYEDDEFVILKKYIETLPNGYRHVIIKKQKLGEASLDNTQAYFVPAGCYFMMGDNRDNSQDSRVSEAVGFVPFQDIMGRAECIFFSSSCTLFEVFKWPFSMRFERFFTPIR